MSRQISWSGCRHAWLKRSCSGKVKRGELETSEQAWYAVTKGFLPPQELHARHPGFSAAWKELEREGKVSQNTARKV